MDFHLVVLLDLMDLRHYQNAAVSLEKYLKINKNTIGKMEGRKEMLYLMTHSTHIIYAYVVKDHSNSETPHSLLFPISSKGSFMCIIPETGKHIPQPLLHQSWSTGWNNK